MKCPDCNGTLVEVSFTGIDKSYRCFKCGGSWLIAKTVNSLDSTHLEENWSKGQVNTELIGIGDNKCPTDGEELKEFADEKVPVSFKVRRCPTCMWFWFPLDTLHKYKPMQEQRVKQSTIARMGMTTLIAALVPLLTLVVMVTGVFGGAFLSRNQNKVTVSASGRMRDIMAVDNGVGRVLVRFVLEGELDEPVFFKGTNETLWTEASLDVDGDGFVFVTNDVITSDDLLLKIGDEETKVRIVGNK